jgi:hypothetical protein
MDKVDAWSGGTILGLGWHNVTIELANAGTSSGGYPQLELEMANNEGSIRDWIVVMDKTLGKVKQVIEATGVEVKDLSKFEPAVLLNRKVRIHVSEEQSYNDPSKMRNRIDAYTPHDPSREGTDVPSGGDDPEDLPF